MSKVDEAKEPSLPKEVSSRKVTEFEGYLSGDFQCFCLSKIPFEEWTKIQRQRIDNEDFGYPDPLLFYPDDFFPDECKEGKWRFKIMVEVTKVE